MNWNPTYGILILFSSIVTWASAIWMSKKKSTNTKKNILVICLLINLGILFIFKYANFISASINDIFVILGIKMNIPQMNILLPVGISFYTFQAIGYTIDVYRKNIKPESNFWIYALFVSFFPQLVAGPIERAKSLLPQFHIKHSFNTDKAVQGFRLILWGYFMKLVISDRLAVYVNSVYDNVSHHSSISLIVASIFFAFQIYCDFGGYSNIAIGCAKIMGFDLMINFNRPYLSKSVAEFWRRWHISLSTWFKDYVYIPLGGNRCSKGRNRINLLITFSVSGIWHGANWTFLIWGTLNGLFQIVEKLFKRNNKAIREERITYKNKAINICNVVITFILITFTWIFFRANNLSDSLLVIKKICQFKGPLFTNNIDSIIYGSFFMIILICSDILQEKNNDRHILLENSSKMVRYSSYIGIVILILMFGVFDSSQFIYFQF
ncbi:MBOAT family O-acyltransferase [Bacteroides sp. CG01]|uniref:MBOAT family O-acyltransferase n=1 Tax=Bacteroides sp. CG01 TaxID=3096000 RepID=UPI002B002888|nr:MBOAT family O-acyltransferase [Bacteroides sp. CG01]